MNKRQYARVVNRPGDFELQPFSPSVDDSRPAQHVWQAHATHFTYNAPARAFSSKYQNSRLTRPGANRASIPDLLAPFRAESAPKQQGNAGDAQAFDECFPEELLSQSARFFNRMHLMAAVGSSPVRKVPLDFEPSFGEDLAAYEAYQSDISKSVALRYRRDVFYYTDNEAVDFSVQVQPSVADQALQVFAAFEGEINEELRLRPVQISAYEYQEMQCAILTLQYQNAGLEQCSARRADEVFALQKRFTALEVSATALEKELLLTKEEKHNAEELLATAEAEKKITSQRLEELQARVAAQDVQLERQRNELENAESVLESARSSVEKKYQLIIDAKNRYLYQKERTISSLQRMLCQYAAGARDTLSAAQVHSLELDNKSLRKQLNAIRAEEYYQIRANTGPQGQVITLLARENCGPEGPEEKQEQCGGPVYVEQQQAIESLLKHNAELRRVIDEQREQQRELLRQLNFLQPAE